VPPSTYTVTEVLSENEWAPPDDPSKRTIFFDFRAKETTQVCSIGRKPDNPLKVGDSFEAEVKSEDRGKLKLKRVQANNGFGGGGGGGKSYEADPKKLRSEAMRSAVHAAIAAVGPGERWLTEYRKLGPVIAYLYSLNVAAMDDTTERLEQVAKEIKEAARE
jgi:hypothetical protein